MASDQAPVVVAIFNTSDDVVELLRAAFELAGLVVVSAHVDDIRRGRMSLVKFLEEHDPRVILYDIAPPYDRSYRFFQHMSGLAGMERRRFVLTSTNAKRAAEAADTDDHIHEIIGKPYDLEEITAAVLRAAGLDSAARLADDPP